jgi:hypothetical protein
VLITAAIYGLFISAFLEVAIFVAWHYYDRRFMVNLKPFTKPLKSKTRRIELLLTEQEYSTVIHALTALHEQCKDAREQMMADRSTFPDIDTFMDTQADNGIHIQLCEEVLSRKVRYVRR